MGIAGAAIAGDIEGSHSEALVNIAPYAEIRTHPYGTLVRRMVDGNTSTGLQLEKVLDMNDKDMVRNHTIEFLFSNTVKVARIRFTEPLSSFSLWANTSGSRKYKRQLVNEPNCTIPRSYWKGQTWKFYEKAFSPPVRLKALKLVNHGKDAPRLMEFQILAPTGSIPKGLVKENGLKEGVPEISLGSSVEVRSPAPEERYLMGFHVEPWMFDCAGWIRQKPRPPLKKWPGFTTFLTRLKKLHCSLVCVFPYRTFGEKRQEGGKYQGEYPYDVMWPSKVEKYSYPSNLLKEFCQEMHEEDFTVFVQDRPPGDLWKPLPKPADMQETLLMNWSFRTRLAGIAKELAACGVDGIPVCYDEQYFSWVRYPWAVAKQSPWAKDGFAKRWRKTPYPSGGQVDSESVRKYVVYCYEQLAKSFDDVGKAARKVNPKVKVVGPNMRSASDHSNNRLWSGVAYDVLGYTADIDYVGTESYHIWTDGDIGPYHPSAQAKRIMAGNPKRQSLQTACFPWGWQGRDKQPLTWATCPEGSVYGNYIGPAMQGAGAAVIYWRLLISGKVIYEKEVETALSILDTAAAWGARDARIPRDIAVLPSRASEDWWQLKEWWKANGKPSIAESIRGHAYEKWVQEFLFTNGYPFELYYLDQPESYKDLSAFKLIILPFPYSISDEARVQIRRAVRSGTKVIAFGQKGATDELGRPRKKPALRGMISKFISDDILDCGHFHGFRAKIKETIDRFLGDRRTIFANLYGSDVQTGCLEKSDREKLIFLVNYGDDAVIDLGVRVPDIHGGYQILERNPDGTHKVEVRGLSTCSSADLREFRLHLKKWEAKVLYVRPVFRTAKVKRVSGKR